MVLTLFLGTVGIFFAIEDSVYIPDSVYNKSLVLLGVGALAITAGLIKLCFYQATTDK